MKIDDSFLAMSRKEVGSQRSNELRKEKAASDFEEIFARHLVKEMTKNSFKMSGTNSIMGNSSSLYREHITDALASELAAQRRLGMADLVTRYWDKSSASNNNDQPQNQLKTTNNSINND